MAAPNLPVTIGVAVSNANVGEFAIIRNLTTGLKLTQELKGSKGETIFNPAPSVQWSEGDLIQLEVRGRIKGVAQKTIKSRSAKFSLTGSTDTTTPGVSL